MSTQAILCYTCTEPHLAHLFFPTIVPYYCRRSFFFLNWARIYLTLINLLLCYQRIFQYLFENYQENKAKYCRIGKQYYSYAIIKFIYLCWFWDMFFICMKCLMWQQAIKNTKILLDHINKENSNSTFVTCRIV